VAKNKVAEDKSLDDTNINGDSEIIENDERMPVDNDARRRLENILEDRALERLVNGDFYDYD